MYIKLVRLNRSFINRFFQYEVSWPPVSSIHMPFLLFSVDGRSCPETISLSVKDNQLPVYQEMATFPCGGHLIGWRTTGAIPNYNIFLGVWIPNYGTQKLLTLLEPLNKTSGGEMEPLIIESGDFMGLVLLNDSISSSSKLDQRPQLAQTPHSLTSAYTKNKLLVAVVPRNTTRGSVLNFEEISFHLIPAEFTLQVQMDYTGKVWKALVVHRYLYSSFYKMFHLFRLFYRALLVFEIVNLAINILSICLYVGYTCL